MYNQYKMYNNRIIDTPINEDAFVRFFHFSPNAPSVDITLPNGTKLFSDVEYREYTDYIKVKPGIYTLQVRPSGNDNVVLSVPNVRLTPGSYNSVYAIGLVGSQPPLEAALVSE